MIYTLDKVCLVATAPRVHFKRVPIPSRPATQAVELMPPGVSSFVCIFDLDGLSRRNVDIAIVQYLIELMARNYPERLEALWFVNEGWLFWSVWTIVKCVRWRVQAHAAPQLLTPLRRQFLPERTRSKIFMLGSSVQATLLEHFEPENLLLKYGGTDDYVHAYPAGDEA